MTPAAPDWNLVAFEVGCARCGHDLRGLTEPGCPACHLEFNWSDAVPLEHLTCLRCGYHLYGLRETRCPECGTEFNWQAVLNDYRRRRKPLFEYHWRKTPLSSLGSSWWLALRPWKLWRTIEIHDPPSLGGLWLLLGVTCLGYVVFAPIIAMALEWLVSASSFGGFLFGPSGRSWLGIYLLSVLAAVLWGIGGLGSLLLLRQSMRQCRVRNGHVFRAFVYMTLPAATGRALFWFSVLMVETFDTMGWNMRVIEFAPAVILIVTGLWTVMSVALAYRLYMKMRHAWAVAITTQIIAFLVSMCTGLLMLFF